MFRTKTCGSLLLLVAAVSTGAFAFVQTSAALPNFVGSAISSPVPAPTPEVPIYTSYKGVKLGSTAADTRSKLGEPRDKADTGDFFVFSDNESAQIVYDGGAVKIISVNYVSSDAAPAVKDVLGEDVPAKPDGSIFKLVRYPKSGCWVSYNRTAGSNPMVIITVQKIGPEN